MPTPSLEILLRAAQFYAHNAHNLACGATFYQDHAALGDLYSAYEDAYDSVIERMIGSGNIPDLNAIQSAAAAYIATLPAITDGAMAFAVLLNIEAGIQSLCLSETPQASLGTQNLLAQLADDSEMRSYKIGQRLKA